MQSTGRGNETSCGFHARDEPRHPEGSLSLRVTAHPIQQSHMSLNWPLSRLFFGSRSRPFPQAWPRVHPLCRCDPCGERHCLLSHGAPTARVCCLSLCLVHLVPPKAAPRARDRMQTPAEPRWPKPAVGRRSGARPLRLRSPLYPPTPRAQQGRPGPPPSAGKSAGRKGRRRGKGGAGGGRSRRKGRSRGGPNRRKGPIPESPRPGRKGRRHALPGAFPARPGDSLPKESPGPPGPPRRRREPW